MLARVACWVQARPLRRRMVWGAGLLTLLLGLPLVVGAVAAGDSAAGRHHIATTAVGWTAVRDSTGARLGDYTFISPESSIFRPMQTVALVVVRTEFVGWWILVTLSIWIIGWVISFSWLNTMSAVLAGVGHALVDQLAITTLTLAAATVGAFFVAYFVARGHYAKAARQIVTMLAVAVFGVLLLADPLAHILGPDGVLAKGRDIGVSVAAGLNGNAAPDPSREVTAMQTALADNFARKPLQVWNFGHVLDDRSCGASWSAGIASKNADLVRTGLRGCGDQEAYTLATYPAFSDVLLQLCDGVVLLLAGLILVFFAVALSIRIVWRALDSVYHALLAIVGLAAGGYVYGPTQTFLIRNLVDSVFAGLSMAAYTIFLGVYLLVLGDMFREAGGQVFSVLVIGSVLEIVAFVQVRRLAASLDRGGQWVASRFAAATQSDGALEGTGQLAGSGSGSYAMTGLQTMAMLTAVNQLNVNPMMAWLHGGTTSAFSPLSRGRKDVDRQNIVIARNGWLVESHRRSQHFRDLALYGAWHRGARPLSARDGFATDVGLMAGIHGFITMGANRELMTSALIDNGVSMARIRLAYSTLSAENAHIHMITTGYQPRVAAAAALKTYLARKDSDTLTANIARGQLLVRAGNFVRYTADAIHPQRLDFAFQSAVDRAMAAGATRSIDISQYVGREKWRTVREDDLRAVGRRVARRYRDLAEQLNRDPSNTDILDRLVWHDEFSRRLNDYMNISSHNPWQGPTAASRVNPFDQAHREMEDDRGGFNVGFLGGGATGGTILEGMSGTM